MCWHGRFKDCGYRVTEGRNAILKVLSESGGHLSAEDIYLKLRRRHPNIGLASVYRTLDILVELGLLCKFDFGDGRSRYEPSERTGGMRHHHHLICTGCNSIIDYTDFIQKEIELLNVTEKGLSEKYDFAISNHVIQFYGLCRACREGKQESLHNKGGCHVG